MVANHFKIAMMMMMKRMSSGGGEEPAIGKWMSGVLTRPDQQSMATIVHCLCFPAIYNCPHLETFLCLYFPLICNSLYILKHSCTCAFLQSIIAYILRHPCTLVLAGREVQLSPDAELLMTPWQVCHTAPSFSNIKARAQPARKTVFKCNIKIEARSKKEARAKFDV